MSIRYAQLFNPFALLALLLFAVPAWAQPARVQVIHNAADPGAALVDIYIEESSTETPAIPDLPFREASAFINAPSGTEITVTVAPGDSDSAADGLASFPFTLEAGETYQLIANGVLDPMMFEANPNGQDIAFTLFVEDDAQEAADDKSEVQFNVVHGSTDAPTVDVVARGVGTLVDDATYSDITDYIGVPPATYILDVTLGDDNDTIVASFEADLSAAAGGALSVLASGFLTPDNDQDGEAFGLLAVFPDGSASLLPAVSTARAQIIHNAADPAAAVVDIYIEEISTDDPAVADLDFRDATPFIDLPAGEELTITVAPGDSDSAADGLASFNATLDNGGTYSIIASGVLSPDDFEANPDGRDIAFTLLIDDDAQEASSDETEAQFNVVHGSTDAPTVDVVARGVGTLVDDASYGDITDYIGVAPAPYTLDVTTADGETIVGAFLINLSDSAGDAITILASGFLTPDNDQDGEAFGLLAVFPSGLTVLLPTQALTARAQIIHNAADPGAEVVDIYIEEISTEDPAVEDLAFRSATPFIDLPAEQELTITVAPGDSESAEDGLASFNATLENGGTFSIIANGVLSPDDFEANPDGREIAFTLLIDDDAQETSTDSEEVQFSVVHGATDAPTIDVVARDVGTLVDDAAYSDITDYIGVPPAAYTLDITTADGSTVVASFAADLSAATGGALTILASGFLTPDNDQDGEAFGLLAVFPDGTAELLPPGTTSAEDGSGVPLEFALDGAYPNPLRTSTTVQFDLGTDALVQVDVFDVLGRRVLQTTPESMSAGAARTVALDASGLPSGAYVYRLTVETAADSLVESGRLTVVR